jgi:putative membrane protein insertion efficiency factor
MKSLGRLFHRVHAALIWVVLLPVALYRAVVSPMKRAPTCKYLPTCSEYAIEALKRRGVIVGGALAAWRILRCNPFARGGYDPVPHRCEHEVDRGAGSFPGEAH